jgi:predicted SnoaL-like aldol condensation-catalyzing enzyme
MSEENNRHIAHLWYEVMWSEPKPELADELLDPNYAPEWVQIPKKGPDQVKHEMKYFRSVFPDLKYKIVETAALPDRVWIRYKAKGTQLGAAWGFPPTGNSVEFDGASILYIRDGKVIDHWGAFSFYDILTGLGSVPPLWELKDHLQWSP